MSEEEKALSIKAMEKGNESTNPVALKRAAIGTSLGGILASAFCSWLKGHYPELPIFEYQDSLTVLFTSIIGLLNYYFIVASSRKVGPLG